MSEFARVGGTGVGGAATTGAGAWLVFFHAEMSKRKTSQ